MKRLFFLALSMGAGMLAGFVWLIAHSQFIGSPFGDYGRRGGSDL